MFYSYLKFLFESQRFFSSQFAHFKDEMYITAQRAFGVSPDRHYRLLNAAVEEKPKVIVLSVIVQEAEGLEAKDANGEFSSFRTAPNANFIGCFIAPAATAMVLRIFCFYCWEIRWKIWTIKEINSTRFDDNMQNL